ncbi:MAG TPA: YoaK family protein [Planctomycetota bacterium]|nr:YoaK family protein [Planctomycetota bacterium]
MSSRRTDAVKGYVPPSLPPRTFRANVLVAVSLSGVAGALNAGGFFAVGIYTSHVTGNWSKVWDELSLGHGLTAVKCAIFVACFILGAATSTLLIEHDATPTRRMRYLKPLVLQIFLLGGFVALGQFFDSPVHPVAKYATCLLSFTMGLQNAMVTKISGAVVRTTHMTGISTDLGIEIARLSLFLRERFRARRQDLASLPAPHPPFAEFLRETARHLKTEGQKAALLGAILGSFAAGALVGAFSFLHWGYAGAAPIAIVLAILVVIEVMAIRDRTEGILTGPSTLRLGPPPVEEPLPPPLPPPAHRAPSVARRFDPGKLEEQPPTA